MVLIEAESLAKAFGDVEAVDALSLRRDDAPVMGLIGPNGARKTVTIKIIPSFLRQDSGLVKVFGQEPLLPERACRIFGMGETRTREVPRGSSACKMLLGGQSRLFQPACSRDSRLPMR